MDKEKTKMTKFFFWSDTISIYKVLLLDMADKKLNTREAAHLIHENWIFMTLEQRKWLLEQLLCLYKQAVPEYRKWRKNNNKPPYSDWKFGQSCLKIASIHDSNPLSRQYANPFSRTSVLGNFNSFRFWVRTLIWARRHLNDPMLR